VVRLALTEARPNDPARPLRPRGLAEPAAHYCSGTALRGISYARLSVRDTGAGISREVLQRIFDPFFTTKTRNRGTGLGLAVVHSIVASLGGIIEVESAPGEGSVFAIYLPLAREAQSSGMRGSLAFPA
jgi:signal transduction histidine kinase